MLLQAVYNGLDKHLTTLSNEQQYIALADALDMFWKDIQDYQVAGMESDVFMEQAQSIAFGRICQHLEDMGVSMEGFMDGAKEVASKVVEVVRQVIAKFMQWVAERWKALRKMMTSKKNDVKDAKDKVAKGDQADPKDILKIPAVLMYKANSLVEVEEFIGWFDQIIQGLNKEGHIKIIEDILTVLERHDPDSETEALFVEVNQRLDALSKEMGQFFPTTNQFKRNPGDATTHHNTNDDYGVDMLYKQYTGESLHYISQVNMVFNTNDVDDKSRTRWDDTRQLKILNYIEGVYNDVNEFVYEPDEIADRCTKLAMKFGGTRGSAMSNAQRNGGPVLALLQRLPYTATAPYDALIKYIEHCLNAVVITVNRI